MRKPTVIVVLALTILLSTMSALADDTLTQPAPTQDAGATAPATVPPMAPPPTEIKVVALPEIKVCRPVWTVDKIPVKDTESLGNPVLEECAEPNMEFVDNEKLKDKQPRPRSEDQIVVYVDEGKVTLGAAQVTDVSWSFHKQGAIVAAPKRVSCGTSTQTNWKDRLFVRCILDKDEIEKASNGDVIEVDVTQGGAERRRFARFVKPLTLASSVAGFWIPVGLFGTNFQSNADGITLAALPVGLAWGGQYNAKNGVDYVGISAFASWTIAPQKADGPTNGNYTLSALSPGAFFDFDGYVYAGYAYAIDFRADHSNPGHMMVVGFGPRLLQFLKGKQ